MSKGKMTLKSKLQNIIMKTFKTELQKTSNKDGFVSQLWKILSSEDKEIQVEFLIKDTKLILASF